MSESGKEFSVVHLHLEELGHALSEIELVPTEAPEASSLPNVMEMTSIELDQLTDVTSLAAIHTKSARRQNRSGSVSKEHSPSHSPRYGKIESQFLPKVEEEERGLVPQRAHKIEVRNGRRVDVTEEEEDKLAIAALKKAEEHARGRQPLSPLKVPRMPDLMLPRSPRGSTGSSPDYIPSPRNRSSQGRPVVESVPLTVSFRQVRAAMAEVFQEVHTVQVVEHKVEVVEPVHTMVEVVSVIEPVVFHVEPQQSLVVQLETDSLSPSSGMASPLPRQSGSVETVDGASHPILSLDFTDREMSDAELVPELSQLPDDRTLVLLLNGNDMLREGAEEINRLLLGGKRIQSLQLQWNLLGSEGAAALVAGVSATKFLRFVDLTGNELEEEGAIALAAGLKENTSLQSLVIPENQIGNEGITVIAHALKHNRTLQTLDVSNNNIFEEGACFLAGVLEKDNCTLVELRLTGNALRNEGASALARAVAVHPVLEHIEVRNAVIDDDGIIDLCNAILNNPANTFEYIDLSLNNFSIRSELYMQDLLMSPLKADVHWKELDASRLFEIDEIDAIVDHFNVSRIIDRYLKEETLLPLIPFDVLLPNISFNDPELSDGLVANVLDKLSVSRTLFIRGMDLLNILLYHLTSSDAIITTVITDNHVIDSIFARLGDFVKILSSNEYNNHFADGGKPRLGFVRFKTLELLVNLMKFNNVHLHEQLVHHQVISHLLDLMFAWPNNNFVHHQVKDLVVIILYSQSEILLTDLMLGAQLPKRLMTAFQEDAAGDVGHHNGYFGHVTEVANYVSTSLQSFQFFRSYQEFKEFFDFVEGSLEDVNVVLETPYDGCAPVME